MFEHGPTWVWVLGGVALAAVIALVVLAFLADDFDRGIATGMSLVTPC